MSILVHQALAVLDSARYFLKRVSNIAYTQPIPHLSGGSIGKHTRHFIDGFQCLLEQSAHGSVINYDKRERSRELEENPGVALRAIEHIARQLRQPAPQNLRRLEGEFEAMVSMETSFDRELLHNIDHAIHHLAIIRIGLYVIAPGLELPAGFGVAPSTLKYRETTTTQKMPATLVVTG
jgi:hypothetical protein